MKKWSFFSFLFLFSCLSLPLNDALLFFFSLFRFFLGGRGRDLRQAAGIRKSRKEKEKTKEKQVFLIWK